MTFDRKREQLLDNLTSTQVLDDSNLVAKFVALKAKLETIGLVAVIADCQDRRMNRQVAWQLLRQYFDIDFADFSKAWDIRDIQLKTR